MYTTLTDFSYFDFFSYPQALLFFSDKLIHMNLSISLILIWLSLVKDEEECGGGGEHNSCGGSSRSIDQKVEERTLMKDLV